MDRLSVKNGFVMVVKNGLIQDLSCQKNPGEILQGVVFDCLEPKDQESVLTDNCCLLEMNDGSREMAVATESSVDTTDPAFEDFRHIDKDISCIKALETQSIETSEWLNNYLAKPEDPEIAQAAQ